MDLTNSPELVPLANSQKEHATGVLGRAFQEDPMLHYAFPEEAKRPRQIRMLYDGVVGYSLLCGEAYTSKNMEGVACWLRPGETEMSFSCILRSGMYAMPLKFGQEALRKLTGVFSFTDKIRKRSVSEPHWYLWALGVDPSSQGQGIGGMLLQPVHTQADADGVVCYLETENERDVAFYEKHGYQLITVQEIPGKGISVWAMLRKPRG